MIEWEAETDTCVPIMNMINVGPNYSDRKRTCKQYSPRSDCSEEQSGLVLFVCIFQQLIKGDNFGRKCQIRGQIINCHVTFMKFST